MKGAVIYALVVALLFALGAGTLDARGINRHLADEEVPLNDAQEQAATASSARRSPKKPGLAAMRLGASSAIHPYQPGIAPARRFDLTPKYPIGDLHFHIPLRI